MNYANIGLLITKLRHSVVKNGVTSRVVDGGRKYRTEEF